MTALSIEASRDDNHAECRLPCQHLRERSIPSAPSHRSRNTTSKPTIQGLQRRTACGHPKHARSGRLQTQPQRLPHAGVIVDERAAQGAVLVADAATPSRVTCSISGQPYRVGLATLRHDAAM